MRKRKAKPRSRPMSLNPVKLFEPVTDGWRAYARKRRNRSRMGSGASSIQSFGSMPAQKR